MARAASDDRLGRCPTGADAYAEEQADLLGVRKLIFPIDRSGLGDGPSAKWEFARRAHARNFSVAEASTSMLFALVHPDRTGGIEDTVTKYVSLMRADPRRRLCLSLPDGLSVMNTSSYTS